MVLFVSLIIGITGMFIPLVIEQGESLSLLKTKDLKKILEI